MPLFDNPTVKAEAWTEFFEVPPEKARRNVGRCPVPNNRVMGWVAPPVVVAVGGVPG